VRSVEKQTHQATGEGASDRDGHDPGEKEQTDTLPVDSLVGTVAKTDTDGSSSDTHGCGDWKSELRKHEDSDGSTHLHRASSTWGVVGDLVTHD